MFRLFVFIANFTFFMNSKRTLHDALSTLAYSIVLIAIMLLFRHFNFLNTGHYTITDILSISMLAALFYFLISRFIIQRKEKV